MARRIYVSPAVITREIDLSQVPGRIAAVGAAFVGLTEKGPAFLPVQVQDFGDFRVKFGNLNRYMYTPYAVRSYLNFGEIATVVRVLGKGDPNSGYTVDLGKPFLITFSNDPFTNVVTNSADSLSAWTTTSGDVSITAGGATLSGTVLGSQGSYVTLTASLYTNQVYELSFWKSTTANSSQVEWSFIRTLTDGVAGDYNALKTNGAFSVLTGSTSGNTVATPSGSFTETKIRFKTEGRFDAQGALIPANTGADIYTLKFLANSASAVIIDSVTIDKLNAGEVLAVLRSRRNAAETEDLISDVSITGNPFDFDIKSTWYDGTETILYNMSLDRTKKQYLKNFLGLDPQMAHAGDSVTGLYVDSVLDYKLLDTNLSQVFQTASFTGTTSGTWIGTGSEYDQYRYITGGYTTAHTPTVISQPFFANGEYNVYPLFAIYSKSDGEASNKDCKISIAGVELDTGDPKVAPKFQIGVRAYDDTDKRLVAYETFTVDMNPESDTYISRVIGDRKQRITITAPGAEPEIVFDGEFPNKSNYIRVEVEDGYPFDSRPSGFYGPAGINPDIPEEHEAGTGYEIDMPYKTDHVVEGSGQVSRLVYLGFDLEGSNTIGVQDRLKGSYTAVDGSKPAKGFLITAATNESVKQNLYTYVDFKNAVEYINSYSLVDETASSLVTWGITADTVGTLTAENVAYTNINHTVASASSTAYPVSGIISSLTEAESLVHALTGDPSTYPDALFVNMTGFSNYLVAYNDMLNYFTVVDTTESTSTIYGGNSNFTMPLLGGHDGIVPYKSLLGAINDGTLSAEYVSALQTIANPDEIDINLLFVPGVHTGANATNGRVPSIALEITEDRGDVFYCMDIGKPTTSFTREYITTEAMNTTVDEAVDSVFGYDSSYAGSWWPWIRIYDNEVNRLVWVPPTVEVAGVLAYNDRVAYPWNAPAGMNRGMINAYEGRFRPGQYNRDILYEGRVNPIPTFVNTGIVVYGQKTLQKRASALDRINVRRLLIYARKLIATVARRVQFENNTPKVQQRLVSLINPILEDIQMKNGLTRFEVTIDETTNPPDIVDRNMLYGKIKLQPARTIEIIILDFIITRSGAAAFEEANVSVPNF